MPGFQPQHLPLNADRDIEIEVISQYKNRRYCLDSYSLTVLQCLFILWAARASQSCAGMPSRSNVQIAAVSLRSGRSGPGSHRRPLFFNCFGDEVRFLDSDGVHRSPYIGDIAATA